MTRRNHPKHPARRPGSLLARDHHAGKHKIFANPSCPLCTNPDVAARIRRTPQINPPITDYAALAAGGN